MHDPSVLMFEIPAPWIRTKKWSHRSSAPRWGVIVRRRTNDENRGERVYPWWRPAGYEVFVAGRTLGLATLIEVWHDDPDGHDAFTVCRDLRRRRRPVGTWVWRHRKHLRWKVMPYLHVRRRFERCEECKRLMWKATRFGIGWDSPGVLHYECSSLRHLRGQRLDLLKHIAGVADATTSWRAQRQVDAWLGMAEMEEPT